MSKHPIPFFRKRYQMDESGRLYGRSGRVNSSNEDYVIYSAGKWFRFRHDDLYGVVFGEITIKRKKEVLKRLQEASMRCELKFDESICRYEDKSGLYKHKVVTGGGEVHFVYGDIPADIERFFKFVNKYFWEYSKVDVVGKWHVTEDFNEWFLGSELEVRQEMRKIGLKKNPSFTVNGVKVWLLKDNRRVCVNLDGASSSILYYV